MNNNGCFMTIFTCALYVIFSIFIPIGFSVAFIATLDFILGTEYFTTPMVGILALILFIVGRTK